MVVPATRNSKVMGLEILSGASTLRPYLTFISNSVQLLRAESAGPCVQSALREPIQGDPCFII